MSRKLVLLAVAALIALSLLPQTVSAQGKKDSVVMGMTLEPPGLDPTSGAAAAIAEVTLYNVYETLTKIKEDGSAAPLLAESWQAAPDLKTYTFKLRKGVTFQNGEPFNAQAVKFSYERATEPTSTNKDKSLFQSIAAVTTPDNDTVVINMKNPEPNLPFLLGQASASIVEPKSAPTNATKPVGTGPFVLAAWAKGSSITLTKWPDYRDAAAIKLNKVVIRFISDPSAQVASLLSGDVDAFPRVAADAQPAAVQGRSKVRRADRRLAGQDHRHHQQQEEAVRRCAGPARDPCGDRPQGHDRRGGRRFRRADRQLLHPGLARLCRHHGYQSRSISRRRRSCSPRPVSTTPLEVSLKLPPPPYARQGGEVLAAQLAKVGIIAKIENVEWAQWLSSVFTGPHNFDLTIVSHVEPFDLVKFTEENYYFGYKSEAFNALYKSITEAANEADRARLLGDAQRMLATDAAAGFLFQPQLVTIANKKLKGVWAEVPQFENDFSEWAWE